MAIVGIAAAEADRIDEAVAGVDLGAAVDAGLPEVDVATSSASTAGSSE